MRIKNVLTYRTARFSLVACATLLAAACGDDLGGTGDDVDDPDAEPGDLIDAEAADAMVNNPPNPDGLGPAPVVVGLPDDLTKIGAYVLLAKTGITNTGPTTITGGHLGLSPAPAGALTGFGEAMHSSGLYSIAPTIVIDPAKIYTTGNVEPTPTNLGLAVLDMQGAYTDAASRTNPDELNLADGTLANLNFAPGLYRWGSDVTITDDITLTGTANDVWIFQVTGTLNLATDKNIILAGAEAKNIFWVVADEVTIFPGAHFEGILFAQTGITMQTNATWTGRGLAQSLVALDDNDITAP